MSNIDECCGDCLFLPTTKSGIEFLRFISIGGWQSSHCTYFSSVRKIRAMIV